MNSTNEKQIHCAKCFGAIRYYTDGRNRLRTRKHLCPPLQIPDPSPQFEDEVINCSDCGADITTAPQFTGAHPSDVLCWQCQRVARNNELTEMARASQTPLSISFAA